MNSKGGMFSGIKEGKQVEIADYYIDDEVGKRAEATSTAIILSEPSDDEELVMVKYTNGAIDYVPQDVIEVLPFSRGGDVESKLYNVEVINEKNNYSTDILPEEVSKKRAERIAEKINNMKPKSAKADIPLPFAKGGVITIGNSSHYTQEETNKKAFNLLNEKLISDKSNPLYNEFQEEKLYLDDTNGFVSIVGSVYDEYEPSDKKIKDFKEYLKGFLSMDSNIYIKDKIIDYNNYLKYESMDSYDEDDYYAKGGKTKEWKYKVGDKGWLQSRGYIEIVQLLPKDESYPKPRYFFENLSRDRMGWMYKDKFEKIERDKNLLSEFTLKKDLPKLEADLVKEIDGVYAKGGKVKKKGGEVILEDYTLTLKPDSKIINEPYIGHYEDTTLNMSEPFNRTWSITQEQYDKLKSNKTITIEGGNVSWSWKFKVTRDLVEKIEKRTMTKEGVKFAEGGKVEKKGNEMIMGGIAGILLGIFLNK